MLEPVLAALFTVLPAAAAVIAVVVVLVASKALLERRYGQFSDQQIKIHVILLILTVVAIPLVVLTLPLSETQQGQLLGLIGILASAAIALAATTFFSNALAGIMLRSVGSFHLGDFVRIGDHFGRVSGRGLFHVEIQTEDRDLTTIPNFHLVTNPFRVVRSSGTIVSSNVSLGYDVPRTRIETLLKEAAAAAELSDPFVLILELGDFAVTYRVAGLLTEVKGVLSARSRLHKMVLDKLHEGGIEIVSPNFMNTRAIPDTVRFIPEPQERVQPQPQATPEEVIFDKAEKAAALAGLEREYESIAEKIDSLKEKSKAMGGQPEAAEIEQNIQQLEARRQELAAAIEASRLVGDAEDETPQQNGTITPKDAN